MPTFEDHLATIDEPIRLLARELRDFVISLGPQVIEQIRPHRVAYAKTLNLRVFLELIPASNHVELILKAGRSSPPVTLSLSRNEDLAAAKPGIIHAFESIQ